MDVSSDSETSSAGADYSASHRTVVSTPKLPDPVGPSPREHSAVVLPTVDPSKDKGDDQFSGMGTQGVAHKGTLEPVGDQPSERNPTDKKLRTSKKTDRNPTDRKKQDGKLKETTGKTSEFHTKIPSTDRKRIPTPARNDPSSAKPDKNATRKESKKKRSTDKTKKTGATRREEPTSKHTKDSKIKDRKKEKKRARSPSSTGSQITVDISESEDTNSEDQEKKRMLARDLRKAVEGRERYDDFDRANFDQAAEIFFRSGYYRIETIKRIQECSRTFLSQTCGRNIPGPTWLSPLGLC